MYFKYNLCPSCGTKLDTLLNAGIQFDDLMDDEEQYFMTQMNQLTGESQAQGSQSLLHAQTPLETELAQYRSDQASARLRPSVDVLRWWAENQQRFPLLARAAKKYLAVQATSCAVFLVNNSLFHR